MGQLAAIFLNVLTPVFALVVLGRFAGLKLGLQARTLSRVAYYLLAPGFVFSVLGTARVEGALAARMVAYILVVQVCCAVAGFAVARLLRRPAKVAAAYILIATFANVGNFGLAIIRFALGEGATVAATIYYVAISTSSFAIGVAAANWIKGGGMGAMVAAIKTPAVICLPPALGLNLLDIPLPPFLLRPAELLGSAMIPVMLLGLGVQFAESRLTTDMFAASAVRLIIAPALAFALAFPFGLAGMARDAGIIQASTPAAVFAAIIALEHDLLPEFVTATVLLSTALSVVTMAIVLYLI